MTHATRSVTSPRDRHTTCTLHGCSSRHVTILQQLGVRHVVFPSDASVAHPTRSSRSMTRNQRPPGNAASSNRRGPDTPSSPSFGNDAYSANPLASPTTAQSQKPLYLCNPFVKAALVKGNFKTIVAQPRYCDLNEVSLLQFFCAARLGHRSDSLDRYALLP